ncbi:MAG: hypothetical protein ACREKE_09750, partial [bacterium]
TLRGRTEILPPWHAVRLPEAALLAGAPGLGALPPASVQAGKIQALIGCDGLWLDALGVEAARLCQGLPLAALRPHWKQGLLTGLDLGTRHLALDSRGRSLLPAGLPVLDLASLSALQTGKGDAATLRGRVLFFRPWPLSPHDAEAFDDQTRVFLALMEGSVPAASLPGYSEAWLGLTLLTAAVLLMSTPLWLALPLWSVAPLWACVDLGARLGPLLQVLGLCLACLCLALAVRLWRDMLRRESLERRFRGKAAPVSWLAWKGFLHSDVAALPAAYAALGPAKILRGQAFDDWMERWGLFQDEARAPDGVGFLLVGIQAEENLAKALLDARHCLEGLGGGIARGTLVLHAESRLGFPDWVVSGLAKERAWALFERAKQGGLLLGREDLGAFAKAFEVRPEVSSGGSQE